MIKELAEQKAIYHWFCLQYPKYRKSWSLSMNGVFLRGTNIERAKAIASMKAQGMQNGEADFKILLPRRGFHGLVIEYKAEQGKHKPTMDQIDYLDYMAYQGYFAVICKGIDAAKDTITKYIEGNNEHI